MKTPKIVRRKSRDCTNDHSRPRSGQEAEQASVFTTGLKLLVLMLQVAGALLQLWRR
jgi:hypothetical protein